jgi:glycosyltransferase involved in cell wall biosynthesis
VRIVFMQNGVLPYQDVCMRELAALGHDLLLVYPESLIDVGADYHFDGSRFGDYGTTHVWKDAPPAPRDLIRLVDAFEPDVVIMRGWKGRSYRAVMKAVRGRALRVMFSSNVWLNAPRQWLGRLTHRIYLDPLFEAVYVPGERSEWFARRLGFSGEQVIRGANSADVALFDRGPRTGAELAGHRRFLYSGRLVWHKGIDVLLPAYERYRRRVADPWDLVLVGDGEQVADVRGRDGVVHREFQPPEALADLMHQASCFVLASHVDFWGVVIHEAAAAGLPLICSDGVGAVPYLVQDGANGWAPAAGSVEALADALVRMTEAGPERLQEMSDISRALATRLTPTIWARHLDDELCRRRARLGLRGEAAGG